MHTRLLHFIVLLLLFTSCEKVVTISIPEEANQVTLNLLMNKDSSMMARLTLSGRVNEPREIPEIKNAVVNLYENGVFKEVLTPYMHSNRTYYQGNTLAQKGATYRVTATVPNRKEVAGSDVIPDTVRIGETRMTLPVYNSWQTKATVSVELHDDPAVQNYYRIRLYVIDEGVYSNGGGWRAKSQQFFEVEEADLSLFNDDIKPEFFTTDALFNGRNPRFILRANTSGNVNKMAVEITSLTATSYNYLNSAFMAKEKNTDGLAEKVIIYSNIENGLGIVGGVAQREYELVR